MTSTTEPTQNEGRRQPLSRERVLQAALTLTDGGGLEALTMRRLGAALDVEAMSLYKHVANRDDILDGLVELVVAEIELPCDDDDWKTAMRRRAHSVRSALSRHPWALGLLESRTAVGPASLRYYDAVIGSLRGGGFSIKLAAHAFWLIDSFIYGHSLQESALPFDPSLSTAESTKDLMDSVDLTHYPHLVELATEHILRPGYHYTSEFTYGLDLILDGLDQARDRDPSSRGQTPS